MGDGAAGVGVGGEEVVVVAPGGFDPNRGAAAGCASAQPLGLDNEHTTHTTTRSTTTHHPINHPPPDHPKGAPA